MTSGLSDSNVLSYSTGFSGSTDFLIIRLLAYLILVEYLILDCLLIAPCTNSTSFAGLLEKHLLYFLYVVSADSASYSEAAVLVLSDPSMNEL
jgi:hypothetical protein